MAAAAAVLTSSLVFRMRGGYFAIGTWVLAEVFRLIFSNVSLLGGGSGQSLTVMTHIPRSTREIGVYLIAAGLLIAASIAINMLLRSRFGLGLTALRDSEDAAESQGVDVQGVEASGLCARLVRSGAGRRDLLHEHPQNFAQRRVRPQLGGRRRLHRGHRRHRNARGADHRRRCLLCASLGARRLRRLVLARHGRGRGRRRRVRAGGDMGISSRSLGFAASAFAATAHPHGAGQAADAPAREFA